MSTWETHELPVLRALVGHFGAADALPVPAQRIAELTGLEQGDVVAVLRRLSEAKPPYILGVQRLSGTSAAMIVAGVTDRTYHELEQDDINHQLAADADERLPQRRQPLPPGAVAQP